VKKLPVYRRLEICLASARFIILLLCFQLFDFSLIDNLLLLDAKHVFLNYCEQEALKDISTFHH